MMRIKGYLALIAITATLVLLAACGGTTPQTPQQPVQTGPLNVRVSRDAYPAHASPVVAVNPQKPGDLLGAALLLQPNPAYPGKSNYDTIDHVGTFISQNGGQQWRDNGPLPVPSGFIESYNESLAFNAQGTGFIVAVARQSVSDQAATRVILWRTGDNGASFSGPVTIAQGIADANPSLAVDMASGRLYIVWERNNAILFSSSSDNGQSFSSPRPISDTTRSVLPELTIAPKDVIHVIFADIGHGVGFAIPLDIVTSSDNGQNFSSPQGIPNVLASYFVGAQPLHLDSYISAATDPHDGSIYVAYTADRVITDSTGNNSTVEDNTDVLLVSSYDGGKTWSKPVRINDDSLSDQDSHFQPQLAVAPNSTLYASYFTLYNSSQYIDLYLAQSTNHGTSFSHSQKITNTTFNPSNGVNGWVGDYQGLALGASKIYPFWNDTRIGHLEIYTAAVNAQ